MLDNCDASTQPKSLEVVYHLFTTRIPSNAGRTVDSGMTNDPVRAAGLDQQQRFVLAPQLDYDRAAKTEIGAVLELRDFGVLDAVSMQAAGSADSLTGELAAAGSWELNGPWLRQLAWTTGYEYADVPAAGGRLRKSLGAAQLSVQGSEFGDSGIAWRGGAALERGSQDSAFRQAELPTGTQARSDYFGLKLFGGLVWRAERQQLSASYGLQLGATGAGFARGFRKHVLDLSYQQRWLPRDFMPQDLDAHLGFGAIEDRGGMPVGERFFGGNRPALFSTAADWQIRAAPWIRSFAQNELARAGVRAAGAERFVALNLTYAPTVWKVPLLPAELRENPQVGALLEGQLTTAESTLAAYYNGRDPAIGAIRGMTREQDALRQALTRYLEVLQAAAEVEHGDLEEIFFACLDNASATLDTELVGMSDADLGKAAIAINAVLRKGGRIDQFGTCTRELRGSLGSALEVASAQLQSAAAAFASIYSSFDAAAAVRLAGSDMKLTRRVIDRFFHEINLAAVAPVLLLDAARLGPSAPGQSAWRYGIGAGIRVSLVNSVRLTLVYAMNPHPRRDERGGALSVSLDIVDLFY
jgi:hypothetical protein